MKNKKSAHRGGRSTAFTLVEILVVMGIIALLAALLIPVLTTVRKMAKEVQQKAQFTTIELALTAFKNDYGDYPPSHGYDDDGSGGIDPGYFGAQTLAEALVGWDMMGFHPNSAWTNSGKDITGTSMVYLDGSESPAIKEANLKARKGPYLELASANVFKLGDLFPTAPGKDRFVICDVFGVKPVNTGGKLVKAGAPILYYKANTSSKTIDASASEDLGERIYNRKDNYLFALFRDGAGPLGDLTKFYEYIADPKVSTPAIKWPSNPESYLLISAGPDGRYGTKDDICNFDPSFP